MKLCRFLTILGVLATLVLLILIAMRMPWQLLVILGILVVIKNAKKARNLFSGGTAAWADAESLDRASMIGGDGLCVGIVHPPKPNLWRAVLGLFNRRIPARKACEAFAYALRNLKCGPVEVRLNNVTHTMVIAPTGAGKGVSLIVPYLLSCMRSMVVIDPKAENARITAAARRAMGHRVVLLDPMKIYTQTPDTLNPLSHLDPKSPTAADDCRALAYVLLQAPANEPDPFWRNAGVGMLTAVIAVVLHCESEQRNLQTVRMLLTNTELRNKLLTNMTKVGDWGGMLARNCQQALEHEGKQLSGVLAYLNTQLDVFDSPAVADSTRTSSFDPADVFKEKKTVYLILPPMNLDSHAALLRMWIGVFIQACMRNGLQERNKVDLILDEAASLSKMDVLRHAVDKLRGYGLRAQFYLQSIAQVKALAPEGQEQTFLSNMTQVYFGTQDKDTCEHISAMLGKETIVVESTGTNAGTSSSKNTTDAGGNFGTSRGGNRNYSQQARELLQPDEVRNLPQRTAITFTPGSRPIASTLLRYYEPQPRPRPIRTMLRIWAAGVGVLGLSSIVLWAWVTLSINHR